ncbi:MAG TPA: ABC transporter ATP-binding protein [Thermoanaerobaculia bacterium]|nr:ABC transporter ATP-binding protein [Thermoanaerobaculia bacterium]
MSPPLLAVSGLSVELPGKAGGVRVVRDVSFELAAGECLGLVGESGCGKSMTALAILGLVPPPGRIVEGRVRLAGMDLVGRPDRELCKVRGGRIAMVFQEPMAALNPVLTIGFQIAEAARLHRGLSRREARREAGRLLELVAMPDAGSRLDSYPHQLSGGQCQRAVLAMALAGGPEILLADEPTTALDVTVQAQLIELLDRLRRELSLSILLITHDFGVVAQACDRVIVLYAGQVVEQAETERLFARPAHPYTRALLAASPRLGKPAPRGALPTIPGRAVDPSDLPAGCAFSPRCAEVFAPCGEAEPPLVELGGGREARCFLHVEEMPAS